MLGKHACRGRSRLRGVRAENVRDGREAHINAGPLAALNGLKPRISSKRSKRVPQPWKRKHAALDFGFHQTE